jgi:uncharacterized protein with beta-barrel porin domain
LLSSFVDAGTVTVDGTLTARLLAVSGGFVGGTGRINARDGLLITGGVLSPGAFGGGIGTLQVAAPTTISGAGMFGVDIASATLADRLNVTGALRLGGSFAVNALGDYIPTFGTSWVVGNASGGITGAFNNLASNLPGVLRPEALVSGNDLVLRITALPFTGFLAGLGTPEQLSIGGALDQVRQVAGTGGAASLFAGLDRLNPAALAAALETFKPVNALAGNQNLRTDASVAATAMFDRLARVRTAERGTMAFNTSGAIGLGPVSRNKMLGASVGEMMTGAASDQAKSVSIAPEWSVFASVTYGYGDTQLQTTSTSEATSWAFTVGADRRISEGAILGFGGSYMSGDSSLSLVGNDVESEGYSLNAYAALDVTPKTTLDIWARAGAGTLDTTRAQAIGANVFTSAGQADTSSLAWGATMVHNLNAKGNVQWSPVLAVVASETRVDAYTENTGAASLLVDKRALRSFQVKAGIQASLPESSTATFRPYGRASVVNDSQAEADVVRAQFVSGGNGALPFTITGVEPTETFGELAAGFSVQRGQKLSLSLEATQTIGRDELEVGSVSLTGRLRF